MTVEGLSLQALRFPSGCALRIAPLAAATVRERAPKVVTKPETMNYRTLLPEPSGLFDPRLFGAGTVIDAPLPEPDAPYKPRKTQFARIPLALPIIHPLFVQHAAEGAGALIGKPTIARGAGTSQLDHETALVAALSASEHGKHVVLTELPVLPPELRSLLRDSEDRWAATPLNRWYQRILARNARLAKVVESGPDAAFSHAPEYAELAQLVHRLFENDELAEPERDPDGQPLPSLRTLCGGTDGLAKDLASEPGTGRHHVARAVLFALGFDLVQ